MQKKYNLSIILPCYDEEKNIPSIIKRFNEIKPKEILTELVLVDNGSKDGSNKLIKRMMLKYPFISIAEVKKNIGYGNGINQGLKIATGEYLAWSHADMQTDIKDVFKAFELIEKEQNPEKIFIRGNRKKRQLVDTFFTKGMSLFESFLLGEWMDEINAQPKLFHKSFLNIATNPPKDFSFDLYFYYLAKKNNYKIKKVDVLFPPRIHGKSHWNTGINSKIRFIKRTIKYSIKLKKELK